MSYEQQSIWIKLGRLYSDEISSTHPMTSDAVGYFKEIVLNYVWEQMRRHGEIHPPFIRDDESNFVKSRKVDIRDFDVKGSDGCLIPTDDGFSLLVKKGLEDIRRRGVIAHELGHTFLFDISKSPPIAYYTPSVKAEWKNVEGPAYEIGRQILLPEQWLKEYKKEPSILALYRLENTFKASKYILARRLVQDLHLWDVCIFFANYSTATDDVQLLKFARGKFKGQSFKGFSIQKKYHDLKPILMEACRNIGKIVEKNCRIGRTMYEVESRCSVSGSVICLIKKR